MITIKRKTRLLGLVLSLLLVGAAVVAFSYWIIPWLRTYFYRTPRLVAWIRNPNAHDEGIIQAGKKCAEAPFLLPTDGYIGFLWGDSFRLGHRHQGIDIFGGNEPGATPVIAAYPGYLTRLPEWKSSLIIRIAQDPLQPGQQIWIYYTHLADANGEPLIRAEFPAGTEEKYVEAGTELGYQGNFSGTPGSPVGVHLHFSIVKDRGLSSKYPSGGFLNELDIQNTLDPSSYLGLPLNADYNQGEVVICKE
jgi:murein DD-endopeptidase MepM/ murein hydrolase activator NlpD